MSQAKVLEVWPVGEDRTAFTLADDLDMTPNSVHKRIAALLKWKQVERVGSVRGDIPCGGSPRAVYRRLW
jgi:hypothetical protein